MLGVLIKLVAARQLHHAAEIQNQYPVRHVPHDREVVRNEDQRQPELLLEIGEKIEDLCLDGDVERRDRLVADDELGFGDQRPGDADALRLPAGKFVRIAVDHFGLQPHRLHHLHHALLALRRVEFGHQRLQQIGNDLAHRHARIERGQRILEDDLQVAAALAHLAFGQMGDVLAHPHHTA